MAKNSSSLLLGNLMAGLLVFFSHIFIARYLKESLYGDYSLVVAFIILFTFLSDFGMDTILVRDISKRPHRLSSFMNTSIVLRFFSAIIAMLIAVTIAFFLDYPYHVKLGIFIFSIYLLLNSFTMLLTDLFRIKLQMQFYALTEIFSKVVFFISILILIYLKASFIFFIVLTLLPWLLKMIILWFLSKKWVFLFPKYNKRIAKYLIKESLPMVLVLLFMLIYLKIDILDEIFCRDRFLFGRSYDDYRIHNDSSSSRNLHIAGFIQFSREIKKEFFFRLQSFLQVFFISCSTHSSWYFPVL